MISFPEFKEAFPELIGNYPAKLALVLNLIDPNCGGVLLAGKRGLGKSLLLKLFKKYLNLFKIPYVEIPLNVTEENLVGGIDVEKTLEIGYRVYQKGLLDKAKNAYVLIEEINLFPAEYLSLIFQRSYNYTIIATLNPEEGFISSHFLDKIGMCVFLEKLEDKKAYFELLRFWEKEKDLENSYLESYSNLYKYIEIIKSWRTNVKYENFIWDYIVEICLKNRAFTHRAEIFLFFASRAYAALKGDSVIKPDYVNFVAPLVLLHRMKNVEEKLQPQQEKKENQEQSQKNQEEPQNQSQNKPEKLPQKEQEKSSSQNEENKEENEEPDLDSLEIFLPSAPKEEIFDLGDVFKPKRLLLKKDRIIRSISGRRTKSKTHLKGGRFVRSVIFSKDKDIDLFGTIKTASPFQKLRGRKDKLIIYKEDIRYKEKERKISHLVVFVVDGSGSMAAQRRMIATKGAILSLLMDCYQKRDKVAMILFRKFNADVVLPPTSSVELAYKKLKDLPTGGNTPLSAGLFEAYKLIKKYHLKSPEDRILLMLVTDGKANIPIKIASDPLEETENICYELKNLSYVDAVVVDTEIKRDFLKMDLAKEIAEWLGALYFALEEIKSESLLNIVNLSKNFLYRNEAKS
ncbi:VWA domain-containing protein [Thermodesulfobacterium hydrogeniphilum]|uniref:VWA domain-containing protein n=1 Tax=Thermodesulfobacterium hydrogeniphilum TaxID=161156 RepID=UPI00056F5DD5|nr:VWA domain-containing protein [Thermodesulfobacterium hydrogeniphilum]